MTNLNFAVMSRKQLREYVKTHPQDQAAFYAYMDKIEQEPGIEITSLEQLDQLILEKLENADINDALAVLKEALAVGFISLEDLKKELKY